MPVTHVFTRREWWRLSRFGAVILALHALGWGLFAYSSRTSPALGGLGTLAYVFGLRHAFDVDHIAAIDNTTRKLLQEGKRPLGVGFFFALGHSAVVCVLALALAAAAVHVGSDGSMWHGYGGLVSTGVSGSFLVLIGLLNLVVLRDLFRIFRQMRTGRYDPEELERRLGDRGLMNRFFLGSIARRINSSWQMVPLGALFGLGFGTATETGLLAVAAGASTQTHSLLAVAALPVLFAAGMTLMDTADGAFMNHAYSWAFSNPLRKIYYNLSLTGVSVAVALAIGAIELMQVGAETATVDLDGLGYAVAIVFVLAWAVSALVWKVGRVEARWSARVGS